MPRKLRNFRKRVLRRNNAVAVSTRSHSIIYKLLSSENLRALKAVGLIAVEIWKAFW
jgi:hypothetical protein